MFIYFSIIVIGLFGTGSVILGPNSTLSAAVAQKVESGDKASEEDHAHEEEEGRHDHEHEATGAKSAHEDERTHAKKEDHSGHSLGKSEAGKSGKQIEKQGKKSGDDHSGHKHDEGKGGHKKEPPKGKPQAGNKESGVKGKKDAHGHDEHEEEQVIRMTETEMKQFGVEVTMAGSGKLDSEISLPGEVAINADRLAHIVPRIPGVVKEVRKRSGDRVKKGEIMAVIESREMADAKAEYLAAIEKVKLAQARFDREQRLWNKKISAEQEYLDAKQALAEQRIALRTSEQKLYALGLSAQYVKELPRHSEFSLTRYEIIAPFDSTVIEKHITLGELLKDGSEPFVIADLDTVWVNLNVYQKDINRIRSGQRVLISLSSENGGTEGRIDYVEPIVKEDTRTALARVIVENTDGKWRPGMFVTARVLTDSTSAAIVVPPAAVQNIGRQTVLFVKTGEGFEPRHVTTGRTTQEGIEINSGLSAGEQYASKGTLTLKAQVSKSEFGGHSH